MRAVQYSADVYVNLDAVLAFRVEPDESHPPKLKLWLPDGKELSVFEPYASVILTLLLPPATSQPPAFPSGPPPSDRDVNTSQTRRRHGASGWPAPACARGAPPARLRP